ncbi:MAG: Type IV leader peptidase family protein [Lentisphaerae bacterium ADurb.Bin242]|nr:MAG: Type IV leader peptidase family protein [Lentisphaerae bacterium ADurb.Bin242]
MAWNVWLTAAVVTPWLILLCRYDWRERRLPNLLTLGGAACILVWRLGWGGVPSFLDGLAGAVVCAVFLLVPLLVRAAGAGDVKMLFACGAVTGLGTVLEFLLFTSLSGLAVVVLMLLTHHADGARLKHYFRSLFDWRYDRAAGKAALPPKSSERVRVPFGLAIASGLWLTLIFKGFHLI